MTSTDAAQWSRCDSFEIARSPRRRAVLRYLGREQSPVDLPALVEHVAAHEAGASETVSPADRRAVRTSLLHVHVPKLEDAGLVRFDEDARRLSLAPGAGHRLAAARRTLLDAAGSLPSVDG